MRKSILFVAVLVLLAVEFVSCTTERPATDENGIAKPLDSLFTTLFPSADEPGGVVLVCHNDTIVYSRCFGMADIEKKIPITDSTVFNIASASKTFTTAAITKLRDQKLLSLDDSLSKFFPSFPRKIFDKVTLRHVLSHTSGLPDLRPRTDEEWAEYIKTHPSPFGYAPDYLLYGREDELTMFYTTVDRFNTPPGAKFDYQDAPYLLLPAIIEQRTGKNFEGWMQQNIFMPAGLVETDYFDPSHPHPRMAHAYTPVHGQQRQGRYRSADGRWDEKDYGETEFFLTRADHGICTTAREFMRWIKMLYGGKVIKGQSLREANHAVIFTSIDSIQYGLGLYVQDIDSKPFKVFHSSNNGGFAIFEAVFPRQNLFYLIFANRADWNRLATSETVDSILRSHNLLHPKQAPEE